MAAFTGNGGSFEMEWVAAFGWIWWQLCSGIRMRNFPDDARRACGIELFQVQMGLEPSDWKPMPSIGIGVREIRIKVAGAFRLIYLAPRPEGVYVLHCFQKKTQQTSQQDIEQARKRFKQIGE